MSPDDAALVTAYIEAADYLVSLYVCLAHGGIVRDLAEAAGAYEAARAALAKAPSR